MTWTIYVGLMCLWSRCFWIMIYLPFRSESMKGTQLNDRKFIFEIFKYGSEQMEGDGWSSARQFGTCLCADGQTEQWNEEDQKVKSRDLWSVAALQDTSLGWLGLLTLTVVSTCMGDCHPGVSACQETSYPAYLHPHVTSPYYRTRWRNQALEDRLHPLRPPSARYQSPHQGHHKV